jgi:hypothetical protein
MCETIRIEYRRRANWLTDNKPGTVAIHKSVSMLAQLITNQLKSLHAANKVASTDGSTKLILKRHPATKRRQQSSSMGFQPTKVHQNATLHSTKRLRTVSSLHSESK